MARGDELLGRPRNRFSEQISVPARALRRHRRGVRSNAVRERQRRPLIDDGGPERLVHAMFRPRLRERLQFQVRGLAAQFAVVVLYRPQLSQRQEEMRGARQLLQGGIVQTAQHNVAKFELEYRRLRGSADSHRPKNHFFNAVVCEDPTSRLEDRRR